MSVKIKTFAPVVKTGVKNATASGLKRATVFLHQKCREVVNIPNTGVRVTAVTVRTFCARHRQFVISKRVEQAADKWGSCFGKRILEAKIRNAERRLRVVRAE